MFAAIAEARREKRCASPKKDGAAAHQIAGQIARLAADRQGARNHAAAGIGARAAFDQNEAAPQSIGGAFSCVAAHMQDAAAHADGLPAQRTSETLAGVAFDVQRSTLHSRASEGANMAANGQLSARHQTASFDSDFPFDAD